MSGLEQDDAERRAGYDDEQPPRRFELVAFDDVQLNRAPAYLIRDVLPHRGLVVIWGPPKCGKSFFAFDLTMHVALGWTYRGLRTMQGPVVYAILEGQAGFPARMHAFRSRRMAEAADRVPFYLCPTRLNLAADCQAFGDSVEARLGPIALGVLVIDTVNRSLVGSESDDRDMGAYIAAADALAKRFDCLVILVHHSGVDATRPRGHTSLPGAVDAQLAIKKDAGGQITATVELAKDFDSGRAFLSRLVPVEVDTDDEGEPITSCVIEALDEQPRTPDKLKRKLPDAQRLALDVLSSCCLDRGDPLPAIFGIPGSPRAVKVAIWREELFTRGALDREAKNPRTDFLRLKTGLIAKSLAAEREGLIWPVA